MEVMIVAIAFSMGVTLLELATDGRWRSGDWKPRLPRVPVHIPIHHGHRHHGRRAVRIVRSPRC
jgi:hypothetical protein